MMSAPSRQPCQLSVTMIFFAEIGRKFGGERFTAFGAARVDADFFEIEEVVK